MKTRKNPLRFMGLLGLLGLMGLFTDNTGFYGFFGFFGFFAFQRITPDERFVINLNKAGKNAFILSPIIFALTTVYVSLTGNPFVYAYAFAATFALQILVFCFSLQYYEKQ